MSKCREGTDAWRTNSFLLVFFPPLPHSSFRRTLGGHLLLLLTLSAFALLLFTTLLLLFTLLQPPSSTEPKGGPILVVKSPPPFALHGMGLLHRRGTLAMPDLVVVHFPEYASKDGVRIFLRVLHRSGLTARSDVVLVFPDRSSSADFGRVIREENDAFLRLLDRGCHRGGNRTVVRGKMSATVKVLSFETACFVRASRRDKDAREPLWGKRRRMRSNHGGVQVPGRPNAGWSYGSIVSFEAGELDPEGSLSGFLDHVPMSLRRWSCYSMLLGRLRRNFKHVMLVDAQNWVVVDDPFARIRNRSLETVILWAGSHPDDGKHRRQGRRESRDQPPGLSRVNPGVMLGGMRGVRRMAEAMQTAIVRAAMRMQQHQRRGRIGKVREAATVAMVGESVVMRQLVGKELLAKDVELVVVGSVDYADNTSKRGNDDDDDVLWLGIGSNNYGEIRRLMCSSVDVDVSEIYIDC